MQEGAMKAFERYDLVREVNDEVNRKTTYRSDASRYFRPDFWEVADGEGDCEDYALAKRKILIARAVPSADIRICAVFTDQPEGRRRLALKRAGDDSVEGDHGVLVVTTPIGDWLLDNRYQLPVQLSDTPYVVDRMQVAGSTEWEHGGPLSSSAPE